MLKIAEVRRTLLKMLYQAGAPHAASALSILDILVGIYNFIDENEVLEVKNSLVILSKGHAVSAQIACLYHLNKLSADDIANYYANGSKFWGLADAHTPNLTVTAGSLGQGLPVAVGMCYGFSKSRDMTKFFVIVGDGELNEGSIWESLMFASHHKLGNLCIIVDRNGYQAMGSTSEVLSLGNIEAKFESFGCEVMVVDAHNDIEVSQAIKFSAISVSSKPKIILAHTIKGNGISFMENDNSWHALRLTQNHLEIALAEQSNQEKV